MLYIVGHPLYSVDILDTDDMVIESVPRKELNTILRNGVRIANIDKKVALKHQRSEIMTSWSATETTFHSESYSGIKAHIEIPNAFSMVKGLTVHNKRYNFYFKYTPNVLPEFVFWIDGFHYEMRIIECRNSHCKLCINNKFRKDLGRPMYIEYMLEYAGFEMSKGKFCISLSDYTLYFYDGHMKCDDGRAYTYKNVAVSMSEEEIRRKLMSP